MRVNLTIFSMIVVDTWLVYSQATGSTELQSEFYVRLAEELIDNNIDSRPQQRRNSGEDGSDSNDESPVMMRTGRVRAGVSCHLTPTKRRCRTRDGVLTVQRLQGRCIECGKKQGLVAPKCYYYSTLVLFSVLCAIASSNNNSTQSPPHIAIALNHRAPVL